MKDINTYINESEFESFTDGLYKAGIPNEVVLALYDNRTRDRVVSEKMLCEVLKAMYKNKK